MWWGDIDWDEAWQWFLDTLLALTGGLLIIMGPNENVVTAGWLLMLLFLLRSWRG